MYLESIVAMISDVFSSFQVGVSVDETVEKLDLADLLWVFGCDKSLVGFFYINGKCQL